MKIPQKVVDKIVEWNTGSERDDVRFDKKICHSLLLSLVHKDQLSASMVNDDVMTFIKGNLSNFSGKFISIPTLLSLIQYIMSNDM